MFLTSFQLSFRDIKIRLLLGMVFTMLIGCQEKRNPGSWYHESPSSQKELGFLVDHVPEETIQNLVSQGILGARQLSKDAGTYEVYGPNYEELKTLFPGHAITSNEFIDNHDRLMENPSRLTLLPASLPQLELIHAYDAWTRTKGEGVSLAIIDTGIDWQHASFTEQHKNGEPLRGWNFAEDNDDLKDLTSHGTAVAGLIGATAIGVAPASRIVPLKVINSAFKIDEGTVIGAIRYALGKKIPILHFSIGKPHVSDLFMNVLRDIENQGALIVAAAGNQGLSCDQFKQYPAAFDSSDLLSVGATHLDLINPFKYTSYANFGDCVSLAAPGGTNNVGLFAPLWADSQSVFRIVAGTSMAAPLVSGAAALLKSVHPEWLGPKIRDEILNTATQSEDLEGYVRSKGLLKIQLREDGPPTLSIKN